MIGYDWVRFVERIPDANPDELGLPDLWFVLPETVVVYDNVRHTARVDPPRRRSRRAPIRGARYREAEAAIDAVVAQLREPLPAAAAQRARARADAGAAQHRRARRTTRS